MATRTKGTPRATAAMRTHFLRQKAEIRIVRREEEDLDRNNPVMPQVKGQLAVQAIDQSGSKLIQE